MDYSLSNTCACSACATIKLDDDRFPDTRGIAFLDDFLFLARHPSTLICVYECFAHVGFQVNVKESVLSPVPVSFRLVATLPQGRNTRAATAPCFSGQYVFSASCLKMTICCETMYDFPVFVRGICICMGIRDVH